MNDFSFEIVLDEEEKSLPIEYVDISVEKSHPLFKHLGKNKVGPLRKRLSILESELMPISYSYDEQNPEISAKRDFILWQNLTGLQIKCVKCENVKNENGHLVLELINFYRKSILLFKNSHREIYKFAIFPEYVKTVDIHFYRGLIFIPCWDSEEELEEFSYIFDIGTDSFIKIYENSRYSWASMVVDETTNPSTLVLYSHAHYFSRIFEARFCRISLLSGKEGDTFFVVPIVEEMYKVEFYTEKGSAKMYIDENANLWLYKLEAGLLFEGYIYVFRPDFTLLAKTTEDYTMEVGKKDGILRGFMQMMYRQKTEDNLQEDDMGCKKEFYMKCHCDSETGRKIKIKYE